MEKYKTLETETVGHTQNVPTVAVI